MNYASFLMGPKHAVMFYITNIYIIIILSDAFYQFSVFRIQSVGKI